MTNNFIIKGYLNKKLEAIKTSGAFVLATVHNMQR